MAISASSFPCAACIADGSEKHAAADSSSAIFLGVDQNGTRCFVRRGGGLLQAMQFLARHNALDDETRSTLDLPTASRVEIAEALGRPVFLSLTTAVVDEDRMDDDPSHIDVL